MKPFLICFLCVSGLVVHCCITQDRKDRKDALSNDPWYISGNSQSVKPQAISRSNLLEICPYVLASGPGKLRKTEYKAQPLFTSRLTYTLERSKWYRIVQYSLDKESYSPKTSKKLVYKGRTIWAEDAIFEFAAAVWWRDSKLGYVEVSSDELSVPELFDMAKAAIDRANP